MYFIQSYEYDFGHVQYNVYFKGFFYFLFLHGLLKTERV